MTKENQKQQRLQQISHFRDKKYNYDMEKVRKFIYIFSFREKSQNFVLAGIFRLLILPTNDEGDTT